MLCCHNYQHNVKSVQIRSFFLVRIFRIWTEYQEKPVFSPNVGKYEPEKTPYSDTFHAVLHILKDFLTCFLKTSGTVLDLCKATMRHFHMIFEKCSNL